MKNIKLLISFAFLVSISLIFSACFDNEEEGRKITDRKEYTLTIASHKVLGIITSSGSNLLTEVYVVKKDDSDTWQSFPEIAGLEYEDGYEYKIKVKETSYLDYRMGDPAWTEYEMVKLLSKEKKESQNIPTHFIPSWYSADADIKVQIPR